MNCPLCGIPSTAGVPLVETLRARGVDGMADAAFGSLAADLDLAEDAKAEDAITAALARLP